jgi:hypothetical protein
MALLNNLCQQIITVGLRGRDSLTLMPGINEVPDDAVESLKGHPSVASRIRDGKIVMIESVRQTADGKKTVEDMLAYIPKIYDTKLLKRIIKEDGRQPVVDAAKAQLDMIVSPKKNEGTEQNEHFK